MRIMQNLRKQNHNKIREVPLTAFAHSIFKIRLNYDMVFLPFVMTQMGLTPQGYFYQTGDKNPRWVVGSSPSIWVQLHTLKKPNGTSIFSKKTKYFWLEAANKNLNMLFS